MAPSSPAPAPLPAGFAPAVCCRKHCPNLATVEAVLRVPAKGGDKANALTLPLGVHFCAFHKVKANVGEFTGSMIRAKVQNFCKTLGDAKPDFRNAWLEFKQRA